MRVEESSVWRWPTRQLGGPGVVGRREGHPSGHPVGHPMGHPMGHPVGHPAWSRRPTVVPERETKATLHRLAFCVWRAAFLLESEHHIQQHGGDGLNRQMSRPKQGNNNVAPVTRPVTVSGQPAMDVTYITERVIALAFPPELGNAAYRAHMTEATAMLRAKHAHNYMVFNVSQRRLDRSADPTRPVHPHSCELGWPEAMAPPLEGLFTLCRAMDAWLQEGPTHVAVLHSRNGRERLGVVMSAYLQYSKVCATSEALDRFAMQRYLDDKVGQVETPSERRFLEYFGNFVCGTSPDLSVEPLLLSHVTVRGVPAFEAAGGCLTFIRIYEGRLPLFTSRLYEVGPTKRNYTVKLPHRLRLRGGVMLVGYHLRLPAPRGRDRYAEERPGREVMFRAQFHTCGVTADCLVFTRPELDVACQDLRFPLDGAVELHFSDEGNPEAMALVRNDPEPCVPDQSLEPIIRWDSMENVEEDDSESDGNQGVIAADDPVGHTLGPLDGSLYATVAKQQQQAQQQQQQQHQVRVVTTTAVATTTVVGATATGAATPTASMDSGISSAGNGRLRSGGDVAQAHAELDALLHDMMLDIQSIPDLKPGRRSPMVTTTSDGHMRRIYDDGPYYRTTTVTSVSAGTPSTIVPNGYMSDDSSAIPYHARPDSQPFTYGGLSNSSASTITRRELRSTRSPSPIRTTSPHRPTSPIQSNSNHKGLGTQTGLASPSMVRKIMRNNTSSPTPRSHSPSLSPVHTPTPAAPWTTDDELSFEESRSNDGGTSGGGMTWLQRQQQKLVQRKEVQLRAERQPQESRLLSELRMAQSRLGTTNATITTNGTGRSPGDLGLTLQPVVNGKGTSEPSSPLLPRRSSSRDRAIIYQQQQQQQQQQLMASNAGRMSISRQLSDTSFDRERPFVAVRRAHEQAKRQQDDPQRLLATSPMGYVPYSTSTTEGGGGLLTTVDGHSTMRSETSTTSWERQASRDGIYHSSTPPTPSFPVHPHTPYANQASPTPAGLPPRSPPAARKERSPSPQNVRIIHVDATPPHHHNSYHYASDSAASPSPSPAPSYYTGLSRRSSFHEMVEVSPANVKFARDVSRYWYKPNISREEAIAMLRNKAPGTFVVRDSNSFPGAYGLALKVATLPPNVTGRHGDPGDELVRHFLIEPTPKGVRLKGCANEPVFTSLSALVYQHSVTALAFPCKLLLPGDDMSPEVQDIRTTTAQQLLAQGAACNVLFLFTMDTESLTGPQAVRKAIGVLFVARPLPMATPVHFKVSGAGITLTDNQRRLFFRRHYPVAAISFCGLDPEDRRWSQRSEETGMPISSNRIFGFVARKPASPTDNQCHLFAELEPGQPAAAIVNFVAKVMMSSGTTKSSVV